MQHFARVQEVLPPDAVAARARVRAFLKQELSAQRFAPHLNSWSSFDAGFSARAGDTGLIGMSVPKEYGGQGMSTLARHVVAEEMLAAGAPCGAHWIAERQSAPQILDYGSEAAKSEILPRITRGTCFFGIGMSEPDAGSDLSSIRARAQPVEGGWALTGTKVWTSNAHRAHYLIGLFRSDPVTDDRHAGLSQFIIDLDSPGLSIRTIPDIVGRLEFNEVRFDDVFVPASMVLGDPGQGWALVTSELGYERSGPDRFLSDYQLLVQLIDRLGPDPTEVAARSIGRLTAHLATLRQMSFGIATDLGAGPVPAARSAIVKCLGTAFEQELPETARLIAPPRLGDDTYLACLNEAMTRAPSFSIRGGTREILKGIIARSLQS